MRNGGRGAIRRSKLRRVITAPFRMITNAGNFYVRSMEGLAGRVESVGGGGGGGGMGGPAISVPPALPKSFSVRSSSMEIDQEGKELVRSVSRRGSGGGGGGGVGVGVGVGMGMRSYSVGVGKIGRIDEDEPCEFEEDKLRSGGVNNNNNNKKGGVDLGLYYSRSKSHAIGQRNFVHVNVNHTNTTTNNNNNVGFVY